GLRERGRLRRFEVRRARLHLRAPRGPARPPDSPDYRRSRTGRVERLPRSLPRRRGEGEGAVRRRRPTPSRRRGRMRSLRGHASPPRQHRRARRQGPSPIEPGADRQELSAPSSNTCRLLARDHAAPKSTLALAKAASLGRERVRPLAWCSRPRSSTALLEGARMYVLIAGGGKIGANLARSLLRDGHGHEVTLIEQRRDRYERLEHEFEHQVQLGDATEIHVLDRAGIARPPDVVVAVTGDDEDNLIICQLAREKYGVGKVVARVNDPRNQAHFDLLGISATVSATASIMAL